MIMPDFGSQLWHNTFSTVDNINFIKWIAGLSPLKQLHVVYLTVILVLCTVIKKLDAKSDKTSEKVEKKEDGKQAIIDSLQYVIAYNERDCGFRLQKKDQDMVDHLKQDIMDQKNVKNRLKRVETKANTIFSDTKDKLENQ